MTEWRNAMAEPFSAFWKGDALKARFMCPPEAVLAQYGMGVPASMDVILVENSDSCVHITMPAAPATAMELSDEELRNAPVGTSMGGDQAYITPCSPES